MKNAQKLTTVKLNVPIDRGEDREDLKQIDLRRPTAGDLRKVKMSKLADMDTDILFDLLPRLATESVTPAEIAIMDSSDAIQILVAINDFFSAPAGSPTT